jgi:hypothetical protein
VLSARRLLRDGVNLSIVLLGRKARAGQREMETVEECLEVIYNQKPKLRRIEVCALIGTHESMNFRK